MKNNQSWGRLSWEPEDDFGNDSETPPQQTTTLNAVVYHERLGFIFWYSGYDTYNLDASPEEAPSLIRMLEKKRPENELENFNGSLN